MQNVVSSNKINKFLIKTYHVGGIGPNDTEVSCEDSVARNRDGPGFLSSTEMVHNCLSAPVNEPVSSQLLRKKHFHSSFNNALWTS